MSNISAPMQGGPVLPAISELQRHPDPAQHQFRPLYPGSPQPTASLQDPPGSNGSPPMPMMKRTTSQAPPSEESPAKKQSKWTPEEDNLTIELRGQGMKWDDIAKRLPGRSSISCRLRYQNYLEKRAVWDEEKKNKLARLYARFKDQMWQKVATEMGIPWRSAESMHWQLGEQEMSARANAPVFQLHPSATNVNSPTQNHIPVPAQTYAPTNPSQLAPAPPPPQQYQPSPLPSQNPGPIHSYHRRTDSNSSNQGHGQRQRRRRNSSFSRRRTDARSSSSVPPQLSPLPQLQPTSTADLVSGPKTTSVLETHSGVKREGDGGNLEGAYFKRRRENDCFSAVSETRSLGGVSPDRSSLRSVSGSVRSLKREMDEPLQPAAQSAARPVASAT